MSVLIHEPVAVVAVFKNGRVKPVVFRWKDKKISIESVSFMWQTTQGKEHFLHFTVIASQTLYELLFNISSMVWNLERVETNIGISTI
ncbi:hypothetical protein HYU89_02300 [Candidatus Collierbacteria bacterium]|nr:hypothetical protein [Candidatus Collierbacteria bacterium]